MKKSVQLELSEPVYCTYHYQGSGGCVLGNNLSIKNWYLNHVMILNCSRSFLFGYSSPLVCIFDSSFENNPHLEVLKIPLKYLGNRTNSSIKKMIDDGYYVAFEGIDDYYVEGKSWYGQRHFCHDGLIFGYDENDRTFSIYAYDNNWQYSMFRASQSGFEMGRKSGMDMEGFCCIYAIKTKPWHVDLDCCEIKKQLEIYLDSSLEKYPPDINYIVQGTVVHDYIIMYLDKLIDGSIPYEKTDQRVFRLIWEHKKVMYDRILAVEDMLKSGKKFSDEYAPLVREAEMMRMLYASHNFRRRDSILPMIRKKLELIKKKEIEILTDFVSYLKGVL